MSGGAAWRRGLLAQALCVVAVCVCVYWVGLGRNGLRSTEGHRAIPAWTMLRTGEALPTRMFEAVYMRKPPGIVWAIVASTALLGESELAARAPSALGATLAALLALWFGRRWFGARWGLYAGLAQALGPAWWPPGRSAEIETLNNLFTAVAVYALVDVVVFKSSAKGARRRSDLWMALAGGLGFFGTALMKGPSALPCLVGASAACAIVMGWRAVVRERMVWLWWGLGLALSGALVGVMAWSALRANGAGAPRVSDKLVFFHLWRVEKLGRMAGLMPLAFAGALPAALGLLFPWGGDAKREVEGSDEEAQLSMRESWRGGEAPTLASSFAVARALAWGFVVAVVVYQVVGVSDARHTMPVGVFAPPLAAYVARGAAGAFDSKRARIARAMLLGRGWGWVVILLASSAWWLSVREPQKGRDSGREAGVALASSLPDGAVVWADVMVESRPEVLWYAQREADRKGKRVQMRWEKGAIEEGRLPPLGSFLLLVREYEKDKKTEKGEVPRYRVALGENYREAATGRAHQYEFVLLRVAR